MISQGTTRVKTPGEVRSSRTVPITPPIDIGTSRRPMRRPCPVSSARYP